LVWVDIEIELENLRTASLMYNKVNFDLILKI
jgi:hypothetical protein